MFKEIGKTKVLMVMGLIVLGLLWVGGCKKSAFEAQSIVVDTNRSQWDLNNTGSSDVIEVFLQGGGIEKIILDSITMTGDKPGAPALKAVSAVFQDKRVRVEFSKNEVANLLSNTSRGSKHFIVIGFMGIDSDEKTELSSDIVLGDDIPVTLTLEIAPCEWDLGFSHSSGTVKAFLRGVGFDKIDLNPINTTMTGDNGALPLLAQSVSRQGNHFRAEFPKNQVLNLLANPVKDSVHTVTVTVVDSVTLLSIPLQAQITITDEDEGEEPGALALEMDPLEWDLNFINSSGKVQVFIRGEGIEKIDLTTILMIGDKASMAPAAVELKGDHIRAEFPKNQVLTLLSEPIVKDSQRQIKVTFNLDGVLTEFTVTITITDEDGDGGEPGAQTLQISPSDWNLNYSKSTGTVMAFIRGEGIDKIDLSSIKLIGDNPDPAAYLVAVSPKLQGDHVRASFPKNKVLGLLLNPVSGSVHTVKVFISAEKFLTAEITVVGKAI